MEKIDLASIDFTPELLRTMTAAAAQLYETIPVRVTQQGVVLAMAPSKVLQAASDDLSSVHTELRFILGKEVEFALADGDQIRAFISRLYGQTN